MASFGPQGDGEGGNDEASLLRAEAAQLEDLLRGSTCDHPVSRQCRARPFRQVVPDRLSLVTLLALVHAAVTGIRQAPPARLALSHAPVGCGVPAVMPSLNEWCSRTPILQTSASKPASRPGRPRWSTCQNHQVAVTTPLPAELMRAYREGTGCPGRPHRRGQWCAAGQLCIGLCVGLLAGNRTSCSGAKPSGCENGQGHPRGGVDEGHGRGEHGP
jgi:hypothetical protein